MSSLKTLGLQTTTAGDHRSFFSRTLIWVSLTLFVLTLITGTSEFESNIVTTAYAQGNETLVNKNTHETDDITSDQTLSNEKSSVAGGIIGSDPPAENCGINPNAPPCCTPGEDEECIGDPNQ